MVAHVAVRITVNARVDGWVQHVKHVQFIYHLFFSLINDRNLHVRLDHCISSCLNNGECVGPNTCSCPSGWKGPVCETCACYCVPYHGRKIFTDTLSSICLDHCTPNCLNNGNCVGPNTCSCLSGWTGAICQTCKSFVRRDLQNDSTPMHSFFSSSRLLFISMHEWGILQWPKYLLLL